MANKDKKENYKKTLQIFVTEDMKEIIDNATANENKSVSEYGRDAICEKLKKDGYVEH